MIRTDRKTLQWFLHCLRFATNLEDFKQVVIALLKEIESIEE